MPKRRPNGLNKSVPVFDGSAINPAIQAAETIVARQDKLPDGFTHRDVQRKGWTGLSDSDHVKAAIDELIAGGYLRESRTSTGGRPSFLYFWNPTVRNN